MSETAKKYYCDKCMKEIISPATYWIIDNHRYCQECYKLNFSIDAQMKNKDEQIAELKQQLAEKDKEIERLKDSYEQLELQNDWYIGDLRDELKEQDKDKIEFAIAELEKVLPSIKATIELAESRYQMKDQVDIIIYNQIEELKKDMK